MRNVFKMKSLLKRPHTKNNPELHIQIMIEHPQKWEIEGLMEDDMEYILGTYLPHKLQPAVARLEWNKVARLSPFGQSRPQHSILCYSLYERCRKK